MKIYFPLTKMSEKQKRRIVYIFFALLVVGGLFWSVLRNWNAIDWHSYHFNFSYLLLALIPHAVGLMLGGIGWAFIMKEISPSQDFSDSFQVFLLSNLGKNLPGGIWHILGRVYLHKYRGTSEVGVGIATGIEILLLALSGMATYIIGLLIVPAPFLIPRKWLFLLLACEGVLLYPPIFNRLTFWFLKRFSKDEVRPIFVKGGTILGWLGLYLTNFFVGGGVLFLVVNSVCILEWESFPALAGAWGISVAVSNLTFWFPFRMGIRDGIFVAALSQLLPFSTSVIIAVVWRVWISFSELFWALVVLVIGRLKSGKRIWKQ